MATFEYKAKTPQGEERTGTVEASSMEAAIEVLQRNNLVIIEVVPMKGAGFLAKPLSEIFGVRQKEVVIFSRQLATLFEARVPITQSLKTLISESTKPALRSIISGILDDVSGGLSLSQAMAKHPGVFSPFYISLVRSGEESGKLQEVFTYLADYMERSYALITKARNALIYPAFVFTAFIGVLVVMLVVVIPKLVSIFEETGQAVPFYTQIIIGLSYFLQHWGFLLLIFILILAIAGWRYRHTESGEEFFDNLKISIPLMGMLYRKIAISRFTDNLGTLIIGGIPIIRALEISADVVGNKVYKKIILDAAESVKGGNTISSAFEKYKEMPPLVTQMIRIGEEAGRLDFILRNIAKFYQREVDSLLDNLVSLIEPALIIFLGGSVGIMVAAILVPLYNISGAI
jgi:type IV pilus assembly protein PilC